MGSGLQWTGNVTILTFKLPTYLQIPRHGHASHCQGARGLLESVRFVVGRSFYLFGQPIDDSYSLINGFERNIFCSVFAQQEKLSWMFSEGKF